MRKMAIAAWLLLLLALTGCSSTTQGGTSAAGNAGESSVTAGTQTPAVETTKSPKNDAAIQRDYEENATIFQEGGDPLHVQDFVITKRRTDEASYTDTVYVTATMVSEDGLFQFIQDCVITYGLYNDGWVLDGIEVTETKDMALFGTDYSEEDLKDALRALGYSGVSELSVSDHTTDLENGRDYYSLTFKDIHKYVTETLDIRLVFFFDPMFGWSLYDCSANVYEVEEDWHIAGTYMAYPLDENYTNSSGRRVTLTGVDDYYDISHVTLKEFFLSGGTNYELADYINRRGYSLSLNNANWSELQYADDWGESGEIFIGKDQLFYFPYPYNVDDYRKNINLEFLYELKPTE